MTVDERTRLRGDIPLYDGTMLSELIDYDRREVDLRVLSDPQVYRLELDRLFGRTWIMVGHETEIPNPGDFVLRYIGEDVVIVSRQQDGSIAILLNVCAHRGMQVCRAARGNASTFSCPYHAWVFGQDGHFVGAPFEREMYGEALDKSQLGLQRARAETLGGVIFGNWDPNAPSLREFFGDLTWYLECLLCRTDAGLEVLGTPQRSLVRANWKCPAEQGSVDGYHAIGLHRSFAELGFFGTGNTAEAAGLYSIDISASGGGLRCQTASGLPFTVNDGWRQAVPLDPAQAIAQAPPPGLTAELVPELRNHLSAEQVELIAAGGPSVGQAFPTFEFLYFYGPLSETEPPGPVIALHTWGPKGPDAFEIWTWVLAERDAPEALKEAGRKAAIRSMGSSGMVEMDDGEAWPSQTRSARGAIGGRQRFRYHAFHGHNPPEDFPGPGEVHTGITRDDGQWGWWQRYFRFMLGEE